MFMVLSRQSHCESSLGSFDECRTALSSRSQFGSPDIAMNSAYIAPMFSSIIFFYFRTLETDILPARRPI